jgi:hypothetical protein
LWSVAKTCEGITAFRRPVHIQPKVEGNERGEGQEPTPQDGKRPNPIKGGHTKIDIIAQNGSEWVKVSTITEKRILHDLAKAGWNSEDDSEDDSEKFDDSEGLLKQMAPLVQAFHLQKVRYRNPTIRLVLTRLRQDASKPVIELLNQIRGLGIVVQTAEDLPSSPLPLSETTLHHMTAEPFSKFSSTLNIDCTILLAFVSDISYKEVQVEEWHNEQISRQIEFEAGDLLLPRILWPACGARELVCTRQAADKMQEVVDSVGTDSEKARASLLIGTRGSSREHSVEGFQKLSDHEIPTDWKIPIEVVDVDIPAMKAKIPPIMDIVVDNLLEVNQSIFLYGWTAGLTTLTSNRVVARAIQDVRTCANSH